MMRTNDKSLSKEKQINKPNFLLVGAAKCGTTSLYRYLKAHPDVYLPTRKETVFMIREVYDRLSTNDPRHPIAKKISIASTDDYLALFTGANQEKVIGEISPTYLYYHKQAIPNIKQLLGDPNILIILRNPVDRAYSSYSHLVRDGVENLRFESFLKQEEIRKAQNWDILNFPVGAGMYFRQVQAYMNHFSKVKVCLMDDLKDNPEKFMRQIYQFLEIGDTFLPDFGLKYNQSKNAARSQLLNSMLTRNNIVKNSTKSVLNVFISDNRISRIGNFLRRKNVKKLKKLAPETRAMLISTFQDDILNLQELIGRDLSTWLRIDYPIETSKM